MPVFGVELARIFPDERLDPYHVAGFAPILTVISITSRLGRSGPWMTSATRTASR